MNILNEVLKMDLNELKSFKLVVDRLIESKITSSIRELCVGDKVKINHKKVAGLTFTVKKINRKKIRVTQDGRNTTYNVSMSLIEKI
jgi:tyrosyl-tRNA synthetase